MELLDLEKAIAQSQNKDWFIEKAVYSFPFRSSTGELTKRGLTSIYRYVLYQISGFKEFGSDLPAELKSSLSYFEALRDGIVSFFNTYHTHGQQQLESQWSQLMSRLSQRLRGEGNKLMDFDSEETHFLVSLKKENSSFVFGAIQLLCSEPISNPERSENLIGAIRAYNYKFEEKSGVGSKKNSEKISLGILRSSFQKIIDEIEAKHLQHIDSENEKATEYSKSIDLLKETKEKLFEEWYSKSLEKYKNLSNSIETRKSELETTYEELLRLKKPAEYWNTRAAKLKKDGKKYLEQLMWLISIGGILIFYLLWKVPDGLMLNIFRGEASAIKWTLLYITMISFVIFGIKTLAKITYSSFHLARDAEEREQLTYVYLSLKNESGVEEKDRQIILQSLFSRSDTGLLKDDSSPTMPGIIDSVLKNNR